MAYTRMLFSLDKIYESFNLPWERVSRERASVQGSSDGAGGGGVLRPRAKYIFGVVEIHLRAK